MTAPDTRLVHESMRASAVYSAAVGMSDEEIEAVVKDALIRARRDLSS